ncbi:MAG TPA: nuclear transport factor 2 family protein [Steroidobacteraceae bacterium]|nr:nuclear transport factor 2 family protein [Steroidobacteraceae bacterium]
MRALMRLNRWVLLCLLAALPAGTMLAAEARMDLARLEASVAAAEGVRAVKRLQHAYAHYLDEGRWSDLADLFTADVAAQFGNERLQGRENLRRHLMRAAGRSGEGLAAGQLNTQLVMQPIVTLGADGRSARGTWHELALLGRYGKSANWLGGIYENEYRLEDGKWKISRVNYIEQYRGAYEDYGHKAPAKWNIPYHFEAAHVGVTVPEAALDALVRNATTGPDADRQAAATARLAVLRAETEVQNLQHAFGYYLDRKLWDDVADLFTAGGSLELGGRGAYVGREHILKALTTFHGPGPLKRGELFDHLLFGTVVTISPDGLRAAARSVQLAQLGQAGEFAKWELGVFENQFVREQGKWKLSAVRYFPRVSTDYDLGWAQDAQPAPKVSREFPPDRKPVSFASYPKLQSVAPSFVHPVTGRPARSIAGAIVKVDAIGGGAGKAINGVQGSGQLLEDLGRQVAREIGVDAVENLNSSYGYYIDESDWDAMSDTYSITAGAKELTGAGVYVGQERIRTALKLRGPSGGRSPDFFTIHQLIQPVIHVSDDGLRAKARLRLFQGGGNADGSSGSWIGGIYENTAVFENGEWKFGIQDLHHLFNASYRNGWGRVGGATIPARRTVQQASGAAAPAPAAGRNAQGGGITQGLGGARSPSSWQTEFPPDRKIRARQYAFPEITEPAFHYVNPVSGRPPKEMMPD